MKRKLSVGIAFIGGSKVVILDGTHGTRQTHKQRNSIL
jgi:hypothetical protein